MTDHQLIFTPSGLQTTGKDGETLYDIALRNGLDIRSICGGKGLCKRCQIEIDTGSFPKFKMVVQETDIPKLTATEKQARHEETLPGHRRLACRAKICADLVVEIPGDSREQESVILKKSTHIQTDFKPAIHLHMVQLPIAHLEDNPSDSEALISALADKVTICHIDHRVLVKLQPMLAQYERTVICLVRDEREIIDIWPPSDKDIFGGAIDIGSTSIALYLYDLCNGKLVYEKAVMNTQIRYGEDLMSRISYIMLNPGGEQKLTHNIRQQINSLLAEAQEILNFETSQIVELICVGNPIMHHLFIGANPVALGQAPFTLTCKNWLNIDATDLELNLNTSTRVGLLPLIGGHVGADSSAAWLTQIDNIDQKSVLLVDIGTNAEIILSHQGRIAVASSPTGPALEGAEISSGIRASHGAIERVRIDPKTKTAKVKIIGYDDWLSDTDDSVTQHSITGICGSGIFEVMVELAHAGLINQSGLFQPEHAPDRFSKDDNVWTYTLVERAHNPIRIKQTDIRAVQLAKAALYAGAQLVAEYLDCTHFDEILLAGAFGNHLDSHYVADIGIIPYSQANIIHSIGNAAGMGAAMALINVDKRKQIIEAVQHIEKIETATEARFQDYFVAAMSFPTAPKSALNKTRRRRTLS